jgi:hypothetical protein
MKRLSEVETRSTPSTTHEVSADLDSEELELRLSAAISLHRLFTVQVFGQLLNSVGRHDDYRELVLLEA